MHLVVCLSHVMDPTVALEVQPEGGRVIQKEPRPIYKVNPADQVALELAMQFRQRDPEGRLTVVTCGLRPTEAALHYGLARGADTAIRIWDPALAGADALAVAEFLSRCVRRLSPDLVFCGNRTLDYGSGQVGPALAGYLDLPQITGVEKAQPMEDGCLLTWRRLDRGARQLLVTPLPAVLVVETGAVTPRYVSILAQLRARQQPISVLSGADLCGTPETRTQTLQASPPKPRTKRVILADSKASAADRMKALLGGGARKPAAPAAGAATPTTAVGTANKGPLKLPPEQAADQILAFLKELGIISGTPSNG